MESYKEQFRNYLDLQRQKKQMAEDLTVKYNDWAESSRNLAEVEAQIEELDRNNIEVSQELWDKRKALDDINIQNYDSLMQLIGSYEALDGSMTDSERAMHYFVERLMETQGMSREEAEKTAQAWVDSAKAVEDSNEEAIAEIIKDTEDGMAQNNTAIEEGLNTAQQTASTGAQNVANAMKVDTYTIGQEFVNGFISGMGSKMADAIKKAAEIGLASANATKEAGKVSSPSKVMAEIGGYYGQGFINGLASYLSMATDTASQLANAAMPGSLYSNYPLGSASGGSVYNKSISAPIAVNVNVQGNVDNPQELVDQLEQMLVERIINNERAFA